MEESKMVKSFFRMIKVLGAILVVMMATFVGAQEQPQLDVPLMKSGARYTMSIEPPISMRGKGFDYDHQIQVALPATYKAQPEKKYPVLWLTDGPGMIHLTVGLLDMLVMGNMAPEMIVVAVGSPSELGMMGFQGRRSMDFAPPGKQYFFDGLGGDYFKKLAGDMSNVPQKADEFLSFLVDQARPELAKKYRMSDDHGLFGHSGGGMFTGYALFARPGAFSKYIIGSPSINASDRAAFRLEEEYAKNHKDLNVSVFFGAGDREIDNLLMAAWGIVSSPVLMAETLHLRQYPSLKVTTRIYSGRNHFTVVPDIISDGIQTLWADDIKALPKSPLSE